MSAIANQPTNLNPLSQIGFSFTMNRIPYVEFFTQAANIPGINLSPAIVPTPFVPIPMTGDHIQFGVFSLTFLVDEQLANYLEIFNWIQSFTHPENYRDQIPESEAMSDGTLTILSANKNPIVQVSFKDMWPMSLSPLQFDTRATTVNYINCTVNFAYTAFTIQTIGQSQ
jgi:hypothetical protein